MLRQTPPAHACSLALALLALAPSSAFADAIEAPPTDCPRGAAGSSSHEGTRCAPTTCIDDASCEGWANGRDPSTMRCEPVGLCIARQTVPVAGRVPDSMRGATVVLETALTECRADSDCPADLRCETAPRCMQSFPAAIAERAGCSCHASAPPGPTWLVLLGLVGLALGLRRARR